MSQVKGRTPFTEKDIEHLTKYLAVYSSTEVGRMGNTPYKDLVDNAEGRWPWSRRHTWQSWRDQYKRNSAKYNREIRRYQRAKGLLKEGSRDDASRVGSKRKASETAEEMRSAKRPKPSSSIVAESPNARTKSRPEPSLFSENEDEEVPQPQRNRSPPRTQHRPEEVEESSQEVVGAPPNGQKEGNHKGTGITKAGPAVKREKPSSTSQRPQQAGIISKTTKASSSANSNVIGERPLAKPRPRLIPRRKIDDDPFISSPAATSPPVSQPPPSSPRRQPPKYVEGPFRNTLSTGSSWPPTRRRGRVKPPTASSTAAPTASAEAMPPPVVPPHVTATATPSSPRPLPTPSSASRGKQVQQHAPANATPSSSKNQLPPGHYKSLDEVINLPLEPPSSGSRVKPIKGHLAASAQSAHGSVKRNPAPIKLASVTKVNADSKVTPHRSDDSRKLSDKKNQTSRPITVSRSFPQPRDARVPDPSLPRRGSEGDAGAQLYRSDDGTEDVFTEQKPAPQPSKEDHGNSLERQFLAQRRPEAPIPHIDLNSVSGRAASRSRRQSSLSTTSRTSSTRNSLAPRPRSSLALGPRRSSSTHAAVIRDVERFEMAGRQHLLGQMAKHYGFDLVVASEAYNRLQDLDKTAAFLKRLRDHTDSAGRALLSEFLSDEDGEKDGAEEGEEERAESVTVGGARDDTDTASISTLQQLKQSHRRRSNGPRQSLTIRPIPDEEVDKYTLTVEQYSAPRRSRAGKYARHGPHIMPYSQTPGIISGQSPDGSPERSPPQIDLNQYSSSPLKARKSTGHESLPPSSPPKYGDDEDVEQYEEDNLELEYVDPVEGAVRGTSPHEVEQELFGGHSEEEGEDGDDDSDDDANIGMDMDIADDDDDSNQGYDDEENGHDYPPETEEAPETDSDTKTVEEEPSAEGQLKSAFALGLDQRNQNLQRHLAHLANSVNRENKHVMAEWEAKQDRGALATHHLLLCEIALHRLKEGEEKPLRLDDFYDEALGLNANEK